jgi:hypothetical protein
MAKKQTSPEATRSAGSAPQPGQINGTSTSPEVADLFRKVDELLREGQADKALDVLARAGVKSPWVTNALGVCQLRLGSVKVAVDLFRGLVLGAGLLLRKDVPAVFKTNYATALLLSGNVDGCLVALGEVGDEQSPTVQRLREAVRRWQQRLTIWQKLNWWMGGQPDCPVTLDFLPGDLE